MVLQQPVGRIGHIDLGIAERTQLPGAGDLVVCPQSLFLQLRRALSGSEIVVLDENDEIVQLGMPYHSLVKINDFIAIFYHCRPWVISPPIESHEYVI
jgi:hypothetical protein